MQHCVVLESHLGYMRMSPLRTTAVYMWTVWADWILHISAIFLTLYTPPAYHAIKAEMEARQQAHSTCTSSRIATTRGAWG